MGFMEAVKTCLQKYFVWKGRASRSEFWWWTLAQFMVGMLLGFLPERFVLVGLLLLPPSISVSVRRLHDRGYSGWLLGAVATLAVAIIIKAASEASIGWEVAAMAVILAVTSIWLIYLHCTKGTEGPNDYGEDPLAGVATHGG